MSLTRAVRKSFNRQGMVMRFGIGDVVRVIVREGADESEYEDFLNKDAEIVKLDENDEEYPYLLDFKNDTREWFREDELVKSHG